MKKFLRRIFGRKEADAIDEEALRTEFRHRYHNFRQLLSNDRTVHDCMVEIEQALRGERPFGMRFVRRVSTRAATATYQVVKHLTALAPGKYDGLADRLGAIQANIHPHTEPRRKATSGPLALDLRDASRSTADLVGAKMAHLGEAGVALNNPIPPGFVLTAEAYRKFIAHQGLKEEIKRRIQAADLDGPGDHEEVLFQLAASLQQLITDAPLPDDVAEEILHRMDILEKDVHPLRVALRSSGLEEDAAGVAFAGQYRSMLNVSRDEVLLGYRIVVASKYGRQAMSYRLNRGIRDEDVAMCVGVMRMVDAVAGGVAYSTSALDPGDKDVSVYSAWGLPKAVVEGAADVDLFRFERSATLRLAEKTVAFKRTRFVCREDEGTCSIMTQEELCAEPSLTDGQALEVARLALRLEEYFESPQDIEWALNRQGQIVLLQARPLAKPAVGPREMQKPSNAEPGTGPGEPLLSGGGTASPGAASGAVFAARSQADLLLFPAGGVLVIRQALPSWAPLLHRASGVISEMGSVAGHLANVAREYGVPALFGLPGALDTLEQGTLVTLDADNRAIYPGRVQSLLVGEPKTRCPIRNSPVHASLAKLARHILPLHLLDPEAPDFKPANCMSLHDIIRFCHEKSVREMFSFGDNKRFPQAVAKQLYHNGPKQFWVLNLEDGFQGDVGERFVLLDNIVSIPMLALWEGINAVPWAGPPPMNARGFLSVMFEATANPALDPSMASHYAQKNYFMISRNFVSLQSRFGFHFCGVEALVGDRLSENYAMFHFQGGAANRNRRMLRAKLIADLLEERDFRVRLRGDAVTARAEGFEVQDMRRRLRALGYLIIHTRQLDMIMADKAQAERRAADLRTELDRFFAEGTTP